MRQVPASAYLIIGDGRVARHLRRYFELEALPFSTWSRKSNPPSELVALADKSTHVLLAISDGALERFANDNPYLKAKTCVHFSGALSLPDIAGAHPLMTFADELYDLQTYRAIPFVLETGRGSLAQLLPGLQNPSHSIDADKKHLYHALCVLSGNFTVLLWEKAFASFQRQLGLPKEVLLPYLSQIAENLRSSKSNQSVLTGPLARGDRRTIDGHLRSLAGDPYREVYEAFVHAHAAKGAQQ